VAIDGSKFKAVNAHDRNFTRGKLDKRMQQIDQCIERYLSAMETADRQPSDVAQARVPRLKEKLETLKAQMEKLKQIESQLEQTAAGRSPKPILMLAPWLPVPARARRLQRSDSCRYHTPSYRCARSDQHWE